MPGSTPGTSAVIHDKETTATTFEINFLVNDMKTKMMMTVVLSLSLIVSSFRFKKGRAKRGSISSYCYQLHVTEFFLRS
jgi:hypothetical protein